MKTKATFRFLSVFLSLAILCSMIMSPVFASKVELPDIGEKEAEVLTYVTDGEVVELTAEEIMFSQPTEEDFNGMTSADALGVITEEEMSMQAAAAAADTGIMTIRAYPLVQIEETGGYKYNSGLYAYKHWSIPYTSTSLIISPTQFNNLNTRCQTYFNNLNDGLTYHLVGWYVVTDLYFATMGTLRYTPSSNCSLGTAERTRACYNGEQYQLPLIFFIDPSLTTYLFSSAKGGWYPQSGSSSVFSTGLGVNSVNSANASTT